MSEILRLGAIGAGAVLQVAHLPVLKKLRKDLPKEWPL